MTEGEDKLRQLVRAYFFEMLIFSEVRFADGRRYGRGEALNVP